ncbi:DNA translocase FtsK [Eubacterium coprostanoligenes]|uniref:DNA translocase FtsK n=1 Tax=Eubacterium coprostanoligenes TaxID=290054 RepID=UPI002353C772|nr:DNA translocase FtsK [Eubacterium coprostanoligenes]MCI6254957.1 DNA translocase FtsK [Eubacterium coprostanoligenes]MDY5400252.1 DNA translocase FtsK [Eubacterium coprostanoligenes]
MANSKNFKQKQNKKPTPKKPVTHSKKALAEFEEQQRIMDLETQANKNRIVSIIIFAFSVLFFFVAVIPGENFWNDVHNVYIGLFGWMASIVFPLLSLAYSFLVQKTKSSKKMIAEPICIILIVLFISAFIYIIKAKSGVPFLDTCKNEFADAPFNFNGGFFGAVLGWLFMTMGKAPAIVIDLLFIIVVIMLLSKVTVNQFFKNTTKPVRAVVEKATPYIEERRERRRMNNVDIPLDDEPPVQEEKPKKKAKTKAEKTQDVEEAEESADDYSKLIAEINQATSKNKQSRQETKKKTIDDIVKTASEDKTEKPDEEKSEPIPEFVVTEEDMQKEVKEYKLPSVDILKTVKHKSAKDVSAELKNNAELLVDTLASFGVQAEITDISRGPTVTRYELKPASGVRISKITNLSDDIALNLAAVNVRIEAPIPGKAAVGIEIPNTVKNSVSMREVIDSADFNAQKSLLSAGLGKDIAGKTVFCDIAKMPHLLIAGTTGSGKSVCMNSIIVSILYRANPEEVKFLMIDPKKVEFSKYENIPHLLVPVVTDPRKASGALGWAVSEMLERYQKFSDTGVRDIEGYNRYVEKHEDMKPMPKIVICIDELADLMMAAPKEVEDSICRLAQMARAAGMHLVIATQRPSVDVITGLIKANISSRIALTVSSAIDSRTILDSSGAEKLLGMGDMLYSPIGSNKPLRVQGCYISDDEVEALCEFIKNQGESEYSEEIQKEIESKAVQDKTSNKFTDGSDSAENLDPLFDDAVDVVIENGKASTSFLQRKLGVGYSRGSKIMDQMEDKHIIGPAEGAKPRKILINKQQWIQIKAQGPAPEFTADNTEQLEFGSDEVIDNQDLNEDSYE